MVCWGNSMEAKLRTGEIIMLLAGLILLISLPVLMQGSRVLWFGAQMLYFLGAVMILLRFLVRGDV